MKKSSKGGFQPNAAEGFHAHLDKSKQGAGRKKEKRHNLQSPSDSVLRRGFFTVSVSLRTFTVFREACFISFKLC